MHRAMGRVGGLAWAVLALCSTVSLFRCGARGPAYTLARHVVGLRVALVMALQRWMVRGGSWLSGGPALAEAPSCYHRQRRGPAGPVELCGVAQQGEGWRVPVASSGEQPHGDGDCQFTCVTDSAQARRCRTAVCALRASMCNGQMPVAPDDDM